MYNKKIAFNESDIERIHLALPNKNFVFVPNRENLLHLNMLRFLQNALLDYSHNNNLYDKERREFWRLAQYILFD